MDLFKNSEKPLMKRLPKKGYIINKAAKDAMYEKNDVWFIPTGMNFARVLEDDEKEEVEELLKNLNNKRKIADMIKTNVYQLNNALKRWYGTSNYKSIIFNLKK